MKLDPLLRVLGADPKVFYPIARAQQLIIRRRSRLSQLQQKRSVMAELTPYRFLCLIAFMWGCAGLAFLVLSPSLLMGAALVVTYACIFLLLIVVTDDLDVLVNPDEYLVLAAHPHDGRSVLLAKLFVVGKSLAFLWLLLFTPTLVGIALKSGSALTSFAFTIGAVGAALFACVAAIFLGAAVVALWGKKAIERVMPWIQIAFQLSYFVFWGGRAAKWMQASSLPPAVLWGLPTIWFLAPFQWATEGLSTSILVRCGLAATTLLLLLPGGARFLGARLGEKLLEPRVRARSERRIRASGRRESRLAFLFARKQERYLFNLLRVHLRSDWKTRSEFLMTPAIAIVVLIQLRVMGRGAIPAGFGWTLGVTFFGWFLLLAMDVLTRSSHPESLWVVLVSPVDRASFAMASVGLVRIFQLLPFTLTTLVVEIVAGGGLALSRGLAVLQVVLFGDLLILMGRGIFPEFPFSQPSRSEGNLAGRRIFAMFVGGLLSAVGALAIFLLSSVGILGALLLAALWLLLRIPAGAWARRRVAAASAELELVASSG